ncbi:hypothetical protein Cgig2_008784 [Carnegiea gigantea]|uniref:Uncharacterized protein n=1 Tax=Carnegiea gigantea TaxID=171969 RepID=A0A9Q1Q5Z8_9CARY|nr:hypothetical protein Cgig2_008784 [Carnegiea gigantea]
MAEEAAQDFCILEMVQTVFYATVVNEAFELGVLSRDLAEHLKLCLEGAEARPSNGQEENSKSSDAPPPSNDDELSEMTNHVRETFKWHLRGASHPPWSLPENYQDLCLGFALSDAEEAAYDFDILKMIQATFDAMVVNDALELGIMNRDMVGALKLALEGLRWLIFKSWLRINKHALLGTQLRR